MSNGTAQVAVLGMRGQMVPDRQAGAGLWRAQGIRLAAFAVLGLYGSARWSSLLSGGTHGRVVGLLGLAVLLAGGRPPLARRSRPAAALATALVLVAAFPLAGVPLQWVLHLRIAVIATAIGEGLSALPQALVPYTGVNQWVRLDIVLGAGVLLFDAALLLAFAPRRLDGMRRAGAALPLVALIAVPSTLAHPRFPYLDGLLLFLLLAAFMLGDRINSRQATAAVGICLVIAIASMLVAPSLARHKPWINYEALAGSLAPKALDAFDWTQSYGPIDWPRRGRTVLEVKAIRPEYWKAEDLDVFDGRAWTQGNVPGQDATPAPSRRALAAWSQTIQVTVRDMKISDVIGAGVSSQPVHVSQPVVAGFSLGTWTTGANLQPGDSYTVKVYAPHPSPSQLNLAGADYAGLSDGYRTILLPPQAVPGTTASAQIVFPSFHSRTPVENVIGLPVAAGASIIQGSVYGGAYRLARRLARAAPTPYAFVLAVERLLAHGYSYNQNPPVRAYPLESFLLEDKRGYCQQFAGAMALLLRMGGVPARVAVGFTEGRRDPATGRWLVTDLDAHAWVEIWFPHIGWVKFDPTPAADPALAGLPPTIGGLPAGGTAGRATATKRPNRAASVGSHATRSIHRSVHSGTDVAVVAGIAAAIVLGALMLALVATRPLASVEALVSELERALARSGRPLAAATTLVELEHRMRDRPQASGYPRALRLARFGGAHEPPTPAQRRAFRRALALGLGPLGKLRALWALPPRRRRPPRAGRRATRAAALPDA